MDDNLTNSVFQDNDKNILRLVFLNILIVVFIIMCYFYVSEFFGSISTPFVKKTEYFWYFSVSLFVFSLFSILAGKLPEV